MKKSTKRRSRVKDKEGLNTGKYADMAISSIGTNKEKEKRKSANITSSDSSLKTEATKEETKENTTSTNTTSTKMPEVFDSSNYDAMKEMKESANMNESELKEVLLNVQDKKPITPDNTINNLSTNIDTTSLSTQIAAAAGSSLEDRRAVIHRRSKQELLDKALEDSNNKKSTEQDERKEASQPSYHYPDPFTSYIALWNDYATIWAGMYTELNRSVQKMNKYWFDLFSKP
jgi:hypothetical protein